MNLRIYLIVIAVMSIITLCAYYFDKQKAIKGKWRTKEKTLLLLSALFGSIGGLFSLYVIRHKNKHWYFVLTNVVAFVVHVAIGIVIYKQFGF